MLSTSKIGGFTLSHSNTNDKLYKKQMFTPHMLSPFQQYKTQLSSNAYELKKKYPNTQIEQIKSLLEQLDNNIEMVADLLEEEQKKHIRNSMEEERSEAEAILCESRKQKLQISKTEDIKILQKSVAKLFKKFSEQKKQKEDLLKKLAILAKENQNLKLMNQQLMKEQMSGSDLMKNLDIC